MQNPTSTALGGRSRDRIRGRAQDRVRARGQRCGQTQRELFSTALQSSTGSVVRSLAQESISPEDAAPLLQSPVILSPLAHSTPLERRSRIVLAQSS